MLEPLSHSSPDVHVLLLEDSDIDAELIAAHLKVAGGYQLARVVRRAEFEQALTSGDFDVVLSDYSLPDFDGLTALVLAREHAPDIPFIFVSGVIGEEFATNAIKVGAIDYVLKRNLRRLPTAIERALEQVRERVERRRAEASLRESEARFRNMADHTPMMMWVTEPSGSCNYLNPAWYNFTGQTEEQGLGFGWLDAVYPNDRAAAGEAFRASNAARRAFRVEYRLRRADGVYRWVIDAAAPRFSQDGEYLGYVGSVVDVDERREAEERARSAEERYRTLFESMDEGFCIIKFLDGPYGPLSDYIHIQANSAYALNTGIANVVGQKVRDMVPEEADEWVRIYRDVLVTGRPVRFERELVATGRHLELAAFRIEPASQRQVAVVFKDVSDRKRAEHQLQTLNKELEGRVRDEVSAREVALAQLHEAQKMETLGQLTGGMAHDFNNLLTPIVSALEILSRHTKEDQRARRLADAGLQAAERARILVQRLLAFSRRQHLQARPVDVARLANGMKDLIARSLGPQVRLTIETIGDLQPAVVDPNQFELSLLNLAVNARDAMPSGGDLMIRVEQDEIANSNSLRPGAYVRVSVTDSGVGMDEDTLRRAVEPFFTTKGVGRGTGLGLSSVHGLAAQSGGHFELKSRPGQGTTAILWLPVSMDETLPQIPEQAAGHPVGPLQSASVLLVDDEDLVRMATAEMLEDAGFVVRHASSGRQALQALANGEEFDMLVTDYAMPGMTGADLTREVRRRYPHMPILLITGFVNLSEIESDELVRLEKPFSQSDLVNAIGTLLASKRIVHFRERKRS